MLSRAAAQQTTQTLQQITLTAASDDQKKMPTSWRSWSSHMLVAVSSWFSISSLEGAAGAAGWGGPEGNKAEIIITVVR